MLLRKAMERKNMVIGVVLPRKGGIQSSGSEELEELYKKAIRNKEKNSR